MYRYRNTNTGQVVEYAQRSVRLDHLPNWSLIDEPGAPAGGVDQAPIVVERPARRAPVAAWRAYAVALGADADQVERMTKAELIDRYGGDQ